VGVSHFEGINIIGTDYLSFYKVKMMVNYGLKKTVEFRV
jgi:hypothetical protein